MDVCQPTVIDHQSANSSKDEEQSEQSFPIPHGQYIVSNLDHKCTLLTHNYALSLDN